MRKISVYFRDEVENWEMMNIRFDPRVYNIDDRRRLIDLGCNFRIFGNSSISEGIDKFLSDESVKEYSFDTTGADRYYYIMRREED